MKKSEFRALIREEIKKALNESPEYEMGDTIEIDTKYFPNFEFPYGTKGVIHSIDKQDYFSDDLVYTVKLKHIDSQGDPADYIYVERTE